MTPTRVVTSLQGQPPRHWVRTRNISMVFFVILDDMTGPKIEPRPSTPTMIALAARPVGYSRLRVGTVLTNFF